MVQEDGPQRFSLVVDPGLHGRYQLIARDEIQLQRKDAKEQIAVGIGMRHNDFSFFELQAAGFEYSARGFGVSQL